MKRRRLDAVLRSPTRPCAEHRAVVAIHAEDKAPVDHHAGIVQTSNRRRVVAAHVLVLPLLDEVVGVERLEADKQAAQPCVNRTFEKVWREHRIHGARRLPEPAHTAHTLEEGGGEAPVAEEMIVEKVQVTAGQAIDLRERFVDGLRIEGPPALEERLLVAEVADMGAPARHHDRIRNEIERPLDQIPANRRKIRQRP
jgi:hypothetical protein